MIRIKIGFLIRVIGGSNYAGQAFFVQRNEACFLVKPAGLRILEVHGDVDARHSLFA